MTSVTHPIRVDFVEAGAMPGGGRLGLTFAPGKKDAGRGWARDVEMDLARLRDTYGATVLVSLMEEREYAMLGIAELLERARATGLEVKWLPIRDVSVPAPARAEEFRSLVAEVVAAVEEGEVVVVHCRGGLGRSGLVAACALVHAGVPASQAIAMVRAARPGAIETAEQERWVRAYAGETVRHRDAVAAGPRVISVDTARQPRTPTAEDPTLDRVLGCLLGGALGDALGYPVEFTGSGAAIVARYGCEPPGRLTYAGGTQGLIPDDTQMTLFTAEGLIRADLRWDRGVCHPASVILGAHLRWYRTQTSSAPAPQPDDGWLVTEPGLYARRAPGNTNLAALRAQAQRKRPSPTRAKNDSKGCGGVMRAAPHAILHSPGAAFEMAVEDAHLTHGHRTGALPAGYLAATVWGLLRGETLPAAMATADGLLATAEGRDETERAIAEARALAARRDIDHRAIEALGGGWVAEEALAIALACALVHDASAPRGFEQTLWTASCHGGDSDSTAAIAGNIVGAMAGAAALPAAWLADLELRDVIERIGRDLFACVIECRDLDQTTYPPC